MRFTLHTLRRFAVCGLSLLFLLSAPLSLCLAEDGALRGYTKELGHHYVTFGGFPQTADGEVQPIVWRVLSVEDGEAYLLSDRVLEASQVHHAWESYGDWLETDLYAYLNGAFLARAFTLEERAALVERVAPGTVFLPSQADLSNPDYGFANNASRQASATDYGIVSGLFTYRNTDQYAPYWTRTRDTKSQPGSTRRTLSGGKLGYIRAIVADLGYRAAVLVRVGDVVIDGGTGDPQDPLRLIPVTGGGAP